jgi:hypothetical protein
MIMLCFPATSALAQRWQLLSSADLGLGYDDNAGFSSEDKVGSFVVRPSAAFQALRSTEESEIAAAVQVFAERYTEASRFDNEGVLVELGSFYDAERNRFDLDASFDTESTLTSEVETSGITQINKQRYRFIVSPDWTYSLSERAAINLGLNYRDISYEDADIIPLFDYRVGSVLLGGSYRTDERTTVELQFEYGRYDAPEVDRQYYNVGGQLGVRYLLTETWSVDGRAGVRQTRSRFRDESAARVEDESAGPTFSFAMSNSLRNGGRLNLGLVRNLLPSGTGDVLDTTRLNLRVDYPLAERWRIGFDTRAYRNRQPNGEASALDRKYLAARLSLGFQLAPSWSLSADYRYRWQDREEIEDSVRSSNAVFLTLTWSSLAEL